MSQQYPIVQDKAFLASLLIVCFAAIGSFFIVLFLLGAH
jgi:hypothetical protein